MLSGLYPKHELYKSTIYGDIYVYPKRIPIYVYIYTGYICHGYALSTTA